MDSSDLVNLSPTARIGGAVIGVGALGAGYALFDEWRPYILTLAIGFVAVALVLFAFFLLRKLRGSARGNAIAQQIPGGTPGAVKKADQLAQLDAMRRAFEQGIQRFRDAGRNLYSTPWYLLVGEPGGGKTEAIRHSQVRFFPGLQDFLQGTGGTINMNWWFTKDAIILDTAGRTFLGELEAGTTPEWDEFLRLIKQHRAHCPINGLLLMIPANTLISDKSEEITRKSGRIAAQFERLQMSLGVRFPVFVVITKCDLIGGFNEFFDNLSDPRQQNQILGWSNPSPLDAEFDPKLVEEHLKTVRTRLLRRRLRLLVEPIQIADSESTRRIDQVDSLYTFGDNLLRIAPRLQQYLETIFVAGAWSQRPLFLRGIYFTSSIQKGSPLDPDLAAALGIPVADLPKDREWDRTRSYFLRDLFMEKVFPEKGLVTRVVNVESHQRRRKVAVLTTAFVATLGLLAWTAFGFWDLQKNLLDHLTFANRVKSDFPPAIVSNVAGDVKYRRTWSGGETVPLLLKGSMDRLKRNIEVSSIYKPVAGGLKGIQTNRRQAHESLVQSTLLVPLYVSVRDKMGRMDKWSDSARVPLEELIRVEQAAAGDRPDTKRSADGSEPPTRLDAMFDYVLLSPSDHDAFNADRQTLDRVVGWTYGEGGSIWPPKGLTGNEPAIANAVSRYIAACKSKSQEGDDIYNKVQQLRNALDAYQAAEKALLDWPRETPLKHEQYETRRDEYVQRVDALAKAAAGVSGAIEDASKLSALGWAAGKPLAASVDAAITQSGEIRIKQLQAILNLMGDKPVASLVKPRSALVDAIAGLEKESNDRKAQIANWNLADLDRRWLSTIRTEQRQNLAALAGAEAGGILYRYQFHLCLLQRAQRCLVDADKFGSGATTRSSDGIANVASLDEQLQARDQVYADLAARFDAAFGRPSAAATSQPSDSDDGLKLIVDFAREKLAHRYEQYALVRAAIADLPAGRESEYVGLWRAWVEKHALAGTPAVPDIPLTATEARADQRFSSQHAPSVLEKVHGGWSRTAQLLADNQPAGADPILDATDLRALFDARKPPLASYIEDYCKYWTIVAPRKYLSVTDSPDWKTFRGRVAQTSANWDKVQSSQKTFVMEIEKALLLGQKLEAAIKGEGAVRFCAEAIQKYQGNFREIKDTAVDSPFWQACKLRLDGWKDLPDDKEQARDRLLGKPVDKFWESFALRDRGIVQPYWDELPRRAMKCIAVDISKTTSDDIRKYRKFPLAPPREGADELPLDDLKSAGELLDRIRTPESYSAGTVGNVSIKEFEKEIADLRGDAGISDPADREWIARARPFVLALLKAQNPQKKITCTLAYNGRDGIVSPDLLVVQGDLQGAINPRDVRIRHTQGERRVVFPTPLELSGPALGIKVGSLQENKGVTGEWRNPAPASKWPLLRLMYDYYQPTEGEPPDKKLHWTVKIPILPVPNANAADVKDEGSVTLEFTFDDPDFQLPKRDKWPGQPADSR